MSDKLADPPWLTVVGGPNGVGKSTFVVALQTTGYPLGRFLNPDDIAQALSGAGQAGAIQAGRTTLRQSRALIASRTTFSRESTLSSNEILRTMQTAKGAGFTVVLLFIGVSDVETSKRRVQVRVAEGGHDIAEPIQMRRFEKTFTAAARAAQIADTALFFDNAGAGHRLVGVVDQGRVTYLDRPTAPWIERATQGVARQTAPDLAAAIAAIKDPERRAEAERLLGTMQREQAAREQGNQQERDEDIER